MTKPQPTAELSVTLRVSEHAKRRLAQRATENGTDIAGYVSTMIERNPGPGSLETISGDVYRRFLESGTNDETLSAELERAKHELRAERRCGRLL